MARTLWLLRHGEAVPHGARQDSDRELTPRGERQARLAGRALARAAVELETCWASPKVRARETARLACAELGVNFEEVSALAAGFGRDDALELLRLAGDGAHVLCVGHEPDLSQLVHDLTGARVELDTGAAAAIAVDGPRMHLRALLRPVDLETMAGSET